jgi:hypothetical protein
MSFLRDVFAAVADAAGQMSKDQMREALLRAGLSPTPVQVSALSVAVMPNRSMRCHCTTDGRTCAGRQGLGGHGPQQMRQGAPARLRARLRARPARACCGNRRCCGAGRGRGARGPQGGVQFTFFTRTKVQMLTPEELQVYGSEVPAWWAHEEELAGGDTRLVLSLLALLIQKYNY